MVKENKMNCSEAEIHSTDKNNKQSRMNQTEIGFLPEDWKLKFVKEFTDCTAGGTPSTQIKEFWNGNIPWMNSGELNKRKVFGTENYITQLGLDNSSTKLIPPHCILIGLAGQGKTRGTVAMNMIELSINQSVGAFYPNSKFSQLYLYYNLQNRYDELRQLSTGDGGRGGLNLQILKSLQIPFPPLPEQEAIAEALSDADAWIESLEQLIAKKRLIKQGAMQGLLTPKEDWRLKKLGEVGKIYGGLSGKTKQDFGSGNSYYIPFMNVMKNVVTDKNFIEKVNLKQGETQNRVLKNDLLFNGSSETPEELGISSVLLDDIDNLYLNSFCFGFRIFDENVSPIFLSYIMRSPYGREVIFYLAQGATRYNLSKANFFNLEIAFPKSLTEQTRIAAILSDMDAELEALEGQLAKAIKVKQGMMQELLTGRTRLI